MSREIIIFDTTLRDGEQAPGYGMNLYEKLEIARILDRMNVDVIEAGMPVSSKTDFEAVQKIAASVENASVAALARLSEKDINCAWEAIREAKYPRIHTFIATSPIHMQYKLRMTEDQVLERVYNMVSYARTLCPEVEFSAEDATRSDRDFLIAVLDAAVKSGAHVINVPDTVGYANPEEMTEIITRLKERYQDRDVVLSVHCHNDLGLACANTLAALKAGAGQFECTLNGIGERAGNAALEEVVMAAHTRSEYYDFHFNLNRRQIADASRALQSLTGQHVPPNKPIVGANAFAHEAGIHQHGMMSDRRTYEVISAEDIGITGNEIVLGKHSGKHAVEQYLNEMHVTLTDAEIERLTEEIKRLAGIKKELDTRDIQALVTNFRPRIRTYNLERFIINSGTGITATAVVQLSHKGEHLEEVAKGDGPIDAAFSAVNKITGHNFKLESYRIQSATEGGDALGVVDVRITRYNRSMKGRGTSTDIIDASLLAYVDAVNRFFDSGEGNADEY